MPITTYVLSPRRACRKLVRLAQNLYWDIRYGGLCGGWKNEPSRFAHLGASGPWSSEYGDLKRLFARVPITAADVLVDVGCGKGRVLNFWLSQGLTNRLIGIELEPEVAEQTRRRLRRYSNVTVRTGNVLEDFPADGTIFYLYSPFGRRILERFKSTFLDVLSGRPNVRIVYYNCVDLDVFARDARWDIEVLDPQRAGLYFPAAMIREKQLILPRSATVPPAATAN